MTNKIFRIGLTATLVFSGYLLVASAQQTLSPRGTDDSQSKQTITFPVAELGNCGSAVQWSVGLTATNLKT